jgi:hypothetical protein
MDSRSVKNQFRAIQNVVDKVPRWVPIGLIVVNCVLYEWVGVFELEALKPIVLFLKIVIPLFLLSITLPVKLHSIHLRRFIYLFSAFMVWGAVATLLSDFPIEGISQWAKFFFRFLFCIAVCLYFMKRPASHQVLVMKVLVIIGVATVVQYYILEMISFMGWGQNYIEIATPELVNDFETLPTII